jgi:hypothetical protein
VRDRRIELPDRRSMMKAADMERVLTLVAKWESAFIRMRAERDALLAELERLRSRYYDTTAAAPASEPE